MANQQLFDRINTTVGSSYTSGGGSLVVASATGLPSVGNFYLIVQAEGANTEEVFLITSRSGTTLTGTGAQWGTSASNHASGAVVIAPILGSDFFKGFAQDILLYGTRANLPASGPPASRAYYRCSDSPYEFFWDGSAWKASVYGYPVTEPLIGTFTAVNSPTTVTTYGGILLTSPAHSGDSWRMMDIARPSLPYTIVAAFVPSSAPFDYLVGGIGWRESSSGKIAGFSRQESGPKIVVNKFTDQNNFSGTYGDFGCSPYGPLHLFKIVEDSSNRSCYVSWNLGKSWSLMHQIGHTDFLTPDRVMFGADSNNSSQDATIWLLGWDQS